MISSGVMARVRVLGNSGVEMREISSELSVLKEDEVGTRAQLERGPRFFFQCLIPILPIVRILIHEPAIACF